MSAQFIRKKNRLPFKNLYAAYNSFFITLCVAKRVEIFGMNLNGEMQDYFVNVQNRKNDSNDTANHNGDAVVASTEITKLCETSLLNIRNLYDNIEIGCWVIMPNHIHCVLHFVDIPQSKVTRRESNMGDVIKSFKLHFQKSLVEATTVSPLLQSYVREMGVNTYKIWQKSFYDHIIRDENDLHRIEEYMYNNPLQWEIDIFNPKNEDKYQKWQSG